MKRRASYFEKSTLGQSIAFLMLRTGSPVVAVVVVVVVVVVV